MHHMKFLLVASILLTLFVGALSKSSMAQTKQTTPHITCGQWNIVSSPSPNTQSNYLRGAAATSSTDVWAVGDMLNNNSDLFTLAEHFDGTQWSVVSTPNPGIGGQLTAVTAISANDAWAVGFYQDSNYIFHTLVEQWNGISWNVVPSPDGSTFGAVLSGIATISATDIWAIGNTYTSNGNVLTLTEHWNGTQWSFVSSPNVQGAARDTLIGVAVASSIAVWAVGSSGTGSISSTLIEKWNGTRWKIIASPNSQNVYNLLYSVVAASSKSIWTAGYSVGNNGAQTLAEQWKNKHWNIVASPNPSATNVFNSIAASSTRDIWAVGGASSNDVAQTLTEKWNGSKWVVVSSPTSGTYSTFLGATVVPGTTDFWAVGDTDINGATDTFIAYYC